ncbi:MAG: adenine deaminase [Oscillospiraceae bacterium]|nr:adenine deaminase [Oscillospiraceae bacterium]
MKLLLKNGFVVNVFTGEIEKQNVLIEDGVITGTGGYDNSDADIVNDVSGKYICPGFIDGHIHIESTMLLPCEFARACISHGTTAVIADPHEIANVCGTDGIRFMLAASENIPMTVYIMLPSCVPATNFDEAGAVLEAEDLNSFYKYPRVLGLGELMNYPAVVSDDEKVMRKIKEAHRSGKIINGHAPKLTGRELDKYIAAGINDDHECCSSDEAIERIRKGQWIMIREGTAARNLIDMLPLFDAPYSHRCILVTDDKHPADIIENGHIDSIIRKAAANGKSTVTGIQMATIQAAQCFGLKGVGAVAPGYAANLLVLDNLDEIKINEVYYYGSKVCENGRVIEFESPVISGPLRESVLSSFRMPVLSADNFMLTPHTGKCRTIGVIPGQLITEELFFDIDFSINNGIDTNRDLLKLAVCERHHNTGHIGLGFIHGIGLKQGAIASSVSHDSHNLIIIGASEEDMAIAGNRIREIGGGNVVVKEGRIIAEMPLPIAGLMSDQSAECAASQNYKVRNAVYEVGVPKDIEPFMNMAFVSLPVIPSLKMTTMGLIDVNRQEIVPLFED